MQSGPWPGRFVEDVLRDVPTIRPSSVLCSPVLWGAVLLAFCVIAPGVGTRISWVDSGELIATAWSLGIPHPTGYPLLTLISRAALVLFPWFDPVALLHILSAVFVSLAAGVVSLLTVLFIGQYERGGTSRGVVAISALGSSLLFATNHTVWEQAVVYEVYGFQTLLYVVALLTVLLALREMRGDPRMISPWWMAAGLVVGFGFANHMMTLFLLPAAGWLVWMQPRRPGRIAVLSFLWPMTVGLSAYVYLLVRSSSGPLLNWGDPSTMDAFLAHVSGKQYRVWMFSGSDVFVRNAKAFAASFPGEVGWLGFACIVAGGGGIWRPARHLFWFCVILIVFTLGYSFNYDIHDIESYYLLVHIVASVLAGTGLVVIARAVERRGARRLLWSVLVPAVLVIVNAGYRFDSYVPADEHSPERFALGVLRGVEQNASVVTGKWDFLYSPILALQSVRRERPDVWMIDLHLLRDRSWYVRSIVRRVAGDGEEVKRTGDAFLVELLKFEKGELFNPGVIQLRWQEFLTALLRRLHVRGPLYADHEIVRDLPPLFEYQPDGYLLRAFQAGDAPAYEGIPEFIPIVRKSDEMSLSYNRFCSSAFINHGLFARAKGDTALLSTCIGMATQIDPSNPLLGILR